MMQFVFILMFCSLVFAFFKNYKSFTNPAGDALTANDTLSRNHVALEFLRNRVPIHPMSIYRANSINLMFELKKRSRTKCFPDTLT